MEEGKLFLSVTVLYCDDYLNKKVKIKPLSASYNGYERDISSISLIVDDRLWFHSVRDCAIIIRRGALKPEGGGGCSIP